MNTDSFIGMMQYRPEGGSGSFPGSRRIVSVCHQNRTNESGVFSDEWVALGYGQFSGKASASPNATRQPVQTQDKRYAVVCNGRIYNAREIRRELESLGHVFPDKSDAGMIAESYRRWGSGCVSRFRGMFAIVLWDSLEKQLFLARDRCGEQPLFFARCGESLCFASELNALLSILPKTPSLNPGIMDMYLHYQYVPDPFTLFNGIEKLPAGHHLTVCITNRLSAPVRYWRLGDVPALNCDDYLSQIRSGLDEAVSMTLRSDVPVGIPLSGGIDSGALAVLASRRHPEPLHVFSVGYPGRPRYDERDQAKALALQLGLIFHEVELPVDSFVDFFPDLVRIMGEPIADPAAFGHYSVPKAAADAGIKVLLSGIGGDELFWGYSDVKYNVLVNCLRLRLTRLPRIQQMFLASRWTGLVPGLKGRREILRDALCRLTPVGEPVYLSNEPGFKSAFSLKACWYGEAMRNLPRHTPFIPTCGPLAAEEEIPTQMLRLLFDTWLTSNCLALGERVSAAAGVESRAPFLDFKLMELVMGLRKTSPDHMLAQKAWLRYALKGVLPDEVLARPKRGFQPPVPEWLSGVVKKYGGMLCDGILVDSGMVRADKAKNMLQKTMKKTFRKNRCAYSEELFFAYKLLLAECWARSAMKR